MIMFFIVYLYYILVFYTKLIHLAQKFKKKKNVDQINIWHKIKLQLNSNFYIELTHFAQKIKKKLRLNGTCGAKLDFN